MESAQQTSSSQLRPTVRPLQRRNSIFPNFGRSHSAKCFSTHKVQGRWNQKGRNFSLDLPKGTVDLQLTLTTLDGVYSVKLDEYTNNREFIPWQDIDYPVKTVKWKLQKQFWKADRSPPYPISPPFPRCRSADLFYNPARAPHLPQGVLRYVPQAHNLVSQTTQLHELTQAGINGSSPSTNPSANPNQDSGAPHPSPVPRRCFSSPPSNQDLSTVCRTSSLLLRIRYLEETFTTFPQTLLTLCRSKISLFCSARD